MEILGSVLLVMVIVLIFNTVLQKDINKEKERVNSLSDEQKNMLESTYYKDVEGLPDAVIQKGLIYELKRKDNEVIVIVMIYQNTFESIDINMQASEFDKHLLKVGDYVDVLLNISVDEDLEAKIVFDTNNDLC